MILQKVSLARSQASWEFNPSSGLMTEGVSCFTSLRTFSGMGNGKYFLMLSESKVYSPTKSSEHWDWIPTSLIPHFAENQMRLMVMKWLTEARHLAEIKVKTMWWP